MQYLDAKISAVRKTATFWDAYNIRESVTDKKDFINKYAKLPNNSSLILIKKHLILMYCIFNLKYITLYEKLYLI